MFGWQITGLLGNKKIGAFSLIWID